VALGLALAGCALWALHRELSAVPYSRIRALVGAIPSLRLAAAVWLTAVCYLVLLGYDALALRYVRRPLAPRRTAFASFLAYAFSQNLGFSALTGASIRYRFWSAWGLSASEVAQGIAFTTCSFWLGVLFVGGTTLIVSPLPSVAGLALMPGGSRALGVALLVPLAMYLLWAARATRPVVIRGWAFASPGFRLALAQTAVSCVDWVLAGAVLFVLLPHAPELTLARVLGVFIVAQIAALISHVPGGLSVFEWLVMTMLRPYLPADALIAALLAYRAIYYLLPLAVATLAFATYEVMVRRGTVARGLRSARHVVAAAAPFWLGGATFVAGLILLISGSTPSVHTRMRWLDAVLPLGVMEVSHFVASVAGVGLLLLANGLRRRLDAAYHLSVIVLGVGILASLLKGFDWEEALALAMALTMLLPARRHFYRRAALLAEPLSPGWIASVGVALAATVWLGFFSFKHVDFSADLWWQFATTADAPRFLRASVGIAVAAILFATARLLRSPVMQPAPPTADDLARAKAITRTAHGSEANLALLGDKSLLFSRSGRSFIQYGVMKRSWVSLGDPVGEPAEFAELVWEFSELADRHGAWPVFYEVHREYLPIYIDLGLTLLKLGEEARVKLDAFSLDGGHRKGQRRLVKDVEASGVTFTVLPAENVPDHLEELRQVSDAWLATKRTREKGFSLGFFDGDYLAHFPIAVAMQDGRIVAFANIWTSGARQELSVDLMRFMPEAPRSVMEYLFIQLMLWGKNEGYDWFCLGMAPLSGFEAHPLAPVWNRLGNLLFRQGEHFYNFRGLRQYKDKFDPIWEPKYLASRAGFALPRILMNVSSLISGGLGGVVAR
jgi:phosphatidylglycerol lysyltransferase